MTNDESTKRPAPGEPSGKTGVGAETGPVRLGRAVRHAFRDVWDHLAVATAISLTWTVFLSVVPLVGRAIPLPTVWRNVVLPFIAAPWLAVPSVGACYVAHLICGHAEVSYVDFWRGAGRLAVPAIRLGLMQAAAIAAIGVNLAFYGNLRGPVGGAAVLLCVYAAVFALMNAAYYFPLLVAQQEGVFDDPGRRARRGALGVVRRAFFLVMGEPAFSLGLVLVSALLAGLMLVVAVPFALIGAGLLSFLATHAAREILVKYGVVPEPPEWERVSDDDFTIS